MIGQYWTLLDDDAFCIVLLVLVCLHTLLDFSAIHLLNPPVVACHCYWQGLHSLEAGYCTSVIQAGWHFNPFHIRFSQMTSTFGSWSPPIVMSSDNVIFMSSQVPLTVMAADAPDIFRAAEAEFTPPSPNPPIRRLRISAGPVNREQRGQGERNQLDARRVVAWNI